MNRRGFLGALAAAPIAGPAAAKNLAAKTFGKMGVSVASFGRGGYIGGFAIPQTPNPSNSWAADLARLVAGVASPEEQAQARDMARVLDLDIASHVSLSPAAAYNIQVQRCLQKIIDGRKSYLREMISTFGSEEQQQQQYLHQRIEQEKVARRMLG